MLPLILIGTAIAGLASFTYTSTLGKQAGGGKRHTRKHSKKVVNSRKRI